MIHVGRPRPTPALLAEVIRSDFVESQHFGSVVGLAEARACTVQLGAVHVPMLPRSCLKPIQAAGMIRAGLDIEPRLLALVAASHSGEHFHIEGVRRILHDAGLDEEDLRCPASLPLGDDERDDWLRYGRAPAPIAMNCSGKHAGMVATCVAAGWNPESYLDPRSPLQVAVRATVEELTGEPVAATAIDGCGAPVFAVTLKGLASAYQTIATACEGTPENRVAAAIRDYPEYVGGSRRDVTSLMNAVPGLIAKDGAEGVFAACLSDGRTVAVKVDDGAPRPRLPVLVAAFRCLGFEDAALERLSRIPVVGGGVAVGSVRAAIPPP